MLIVGLTGGISTGKSTVSKYIQKQGIEIIDADIIAKKIMEPGEEGYRNVVKHFGREILVEGSEEIDRKKLGKIIFDNTEKRMLLNKCTHPVVRKKLILQVLKQYLKGSKLCVLDVPLLFEAKLDRYCGKTIVVSCSEETQRQRLMKRDSISEEDANLRIMSQLSMVEKRKRADIVVDNNGTIDDTYAQVKQILVEIEPSIVKTYSAIIGPVSIIGSMIGMGITRQYSTYFKGVVAGLVICVYSFFGY